MLGIRSKKQIIEVPVFKPDSVLVAKYDSLLRVDSILSDSVSKLKILYEKSKAQKPVKYYYSDSDLVQYYRAIISNLRSKER